MPDLRQALGAGPPAGTLQITVFIPSVDRNSVPIDQAYWRDETLRVLGVLFRGATAFPPGRGVWRDDQSGSLVFDETVMVTSYVISDSLELGMNGLRRHLHAWGARRLRAKSASLSAATTTESQSTTLRRCPVSNDSTRRARADALGASRAVEVSAEHAQGPLGLVQLRAEVENRLRSSGGRPTDPAWTIRRVVPFKPDGWAELEELAARLTARGRSVSPAQLAALLIERGLADLEEGIARDGESALGAFGR